MVKASIVIPSLDREDSLKLCLASLEEQDEQDTEVILLREKGELAKLRNEGWRKAKSDIVVFIDDDVVCQKTWLSGILRAFNDPRVGGVSGPSIIPLAFQGNRDIFRVKWAKVIYDKFFCEGKETLTGHITHSGAWTTGASLEDCVYEGEVDFLEACNQSYRKSCLEAVGGFDENYRGVGDWSEPDLSMRIRQSGYKLLFTQGARLYHLPSKTGAYAKRLSDNTRYHNYRLFAKRWVKPCFKHWLYLRFLEGYFLAKRMRVV